MKIIDIISSKKPSLSFEVFPPKNSDTYESVSEAAFEIAKIKPSFMSVTYGAGGGTGDYTISIAKGIMDLGVTPIAHLTCVASSKEKISSQIELLKENGIENILALRGDKPANMETLPENPDFRYASELITEIKKHGDFCIGGACYPEGHVECATLQEDIKNIKIKVDSGCQFLTTQMFFDNNILYSYLYKLREAGVNVPVIAGIMPVTNANQIKRITKLSGTFLPGRFRRIVDRFGDNPEAMSSAGIAYATEQIIDLIANGVNAVHVYSMNKPYVAQKIAENLSKII